MTLKTTTTLLWPSQARLSGYPLQVEPFRAALTFPLASVRSYKSRTHTGADLRFYRAFLVNLFRLRPSDVSQLRRQRFLAFPTGDCSAVTNQLSSQSAYQPTLASNASYGAIIP